jgi:hypothetical protein
MSDPGARWDDPESSHDAARESRKRAKAQRKRVLFWYADHPDEIFNSSEVSHYLNGTSMGNGLWRRVSDCKLNKWIAETGIRRKSLTSNNRTECYRITPLGLEEAEKLRALEPPTSSS